MCRSHTDPKGYHRCKDTGDERLAKAKWRASKSLTAEYTSQLNTARTSRTEPTATVTDPAVGKKERQTELLRIIHKEDINPDGPPLTVKQQNDKVIAAYVELGSMVADDAGNNDSLLEEANTERDARNAKILKNTEKIRANERKIIQLRRDDDDEAADKLAARTVKLKEETQELLNQREEKDEKLESFFTGRRNSYVESLKKFGVEFAEDTQIVASKDGSHKKAVETVNSILKYFPKEWIDRINKENPPMIKTSKKRSHYTGAAIESRYKLLQELKYTTKPAGWEPDRNSSHEKDYIQIPVDEYGDATYVNPESGKSMTISTNSPDETVWVVPQYQYYQGDDEPSDPQKWEKVEVEQKHLNRETREWENRKTTRWRKPSRKRQEVDMVSAPRLAIPDTNPNADIYIYGATNAQSVALHELTHRIEEHNPEVREAESAFIYHRTKMGTAEAEELSHISNGEYGYRDNFANHYMGRDYGGTYYEIMSVGLEGLWFGKNGGHVKSGPYAADTEYRNFLLGTLAATAHKKQPRP